MQTTPTEKIYFTFKNIKIQTNTIYLKDHRFSSTVFGKEELFLDHLFRARR